MSKDQLVRLEFSSEYLKHSDLDTYETKIHIVKWMVCKQCYTVFDNAESSVSAHCITQLINYGM